MECSILESENLEQKRHIDLFILRLAYLFDSFALTLVFPIFARLIIARGFGFETETLSTTWRPIFLGIAIIAFPLSQYFGILTLLKFRFDTGVKTWLLGTLFLMVIGFALSTYAIYLNSFILLVVSRIITGFGASNYIIGHCIAEKIHTHTRQKFSLHLFTLTLTGLIIGIASGGLFSNRGLDSFFTSLTPFLISTIIALCIWIFTCFGKFSIETTTVRNVCSSCYPGYAIKRVQNSQLFLYIAIFLLVLTSWFMILQFLSAFLVIEYMATQTTITLSLIIMALSFFCFFLFIYPPLKRIFTSYHPFLIFSLAGSSLFLILLSFATQIWVSIVFHALFAAYAAMIWRATSEIIDEKKRSSSSNITGLKQATFLSSAILAPIIASPLCVVDVWLIYYVALVFNLIALGLNFIQRRSKE